MAAYNRVYDLRHLQADCQEPGSAPEPYALPFFTCYSYMQRDSRADTKYMRLRDTFGLLPVSVFIISRVLRSLWILAI